MKNLGVRYVSHAGSSLTSSNCISPRPQITNGEGGVSQFSEAINSTKNLTTPWKSSSVKYTLLDFRKNMDNFEAPEQNESTLVFSNKNSELTSPVFRLQLSPKKYEPEILI